MISHVTRFQNLSGEKFFFKPFPLEDELLSSWLARVAHKHNTKTTSFTNMHFKDYFKHYPIWQRDLDIWAPTKLLDILSYKSDFNIEMISKTLLKQYEGKLVKKMSGKTHTSFIQSRNSTFNKNRNMGLRYCPYCLKEDKIPYFRKKWRLSFYTICAKHHVFLQNTCIKCNKHINLSKNYKDKDFSHCYNCGYNLKDIRLNKLPIKKVENVKEYLKILNDGYTYRNNIFIPSVEYFKLIKQINKIIYLWNKRKFKYPNSENISTINFKLNINVNNYEDLLDVEDQFNLYYYSYMITNSPSSFKKFLTVNKITNYQLYKDI